MLARKLEYTFNKDHTQTKCFVQLSRQLLAATLLRQHHANRDNGDSHSGPRRTRLEKPRTFIIHHASSTMFAPESLLQSILKASMISARSLPSDPESIPRSGSGLGSGSGSGAGPWSNQPTITTDQAINLLDDVHLIPIFDFPGAVHAIGLVIDEVHRAVGTDPITTSTPATGSPKTGTSITVRNVSTITYQTNDSTQQEMEEEDNEDGEDNTHIIEESPAQAPASSPVKPDKEKSPTAHLPAPLITIIIEGIDTLTENNVIKPSTPMRGTAMLTPVLRTLTHISRMYPNLVAVMLVNWLGLGTTSTISTTKTTTTSTATATTTAAAAGSITGAGGEGGGGGGGGSGGGGGRPVTSNELSGISVADDGGLHSIFTQLSPNFKYGPSMMSSTLSSTSVRQGLGTGTSLCPSLLLRTLDQGVDVHLMISSNGLLRGGSVRGGGAATTGGRRVEAYDLVTAVEVIKDRVGSNVGRWCVWE